MEMSRLDWNATVDSIRETVPKTQFHNWIQPVEFLRQDEGRVVLGVPSRFHEEWVKNHYAQDIRKAIHKHCGSDLQLEFEVLAQEVEEQNIEACVAPPTLPVTLPTLPVPVGRPNLRVVSSDPAQVHNDLAPATQEDPGLPPIKNPLVELEFNRVAIRCGFLFVDQASLGINPLVITGSIGSGKTHLLTEIGLRFQKQYPTKTVRYCNAEAFTAEMVAAIKTDRMVEFKRKYRTQTDCLIFDDFHQMNNRMKSQEELLHIFNEITQHGGKIVFASSIAINRLENFIEPMRSRLLSGLLCEIRHPSFTERVELLEQLSQSNGLTIEPTVLRQIADGGQKDVRELIGSMLRFHLQARLQNKSLDGDFLAQEGMSHRITKTAVTLEEIVGLVEHTFRVPRTELVSKSRKGNTNWARQVAMFLARQYTLAPLEEIGKAFGRDHATVIHAFSKVSEAMEKSPSRRYEVEFLKQKLELKASQSPLSHSPLRM